MIYRKLQLIINKYKTKINELRKHKKYDYIEYHRIRASIQQFQKLLGSKNKSDIIDSRLKEVLS